LDPEACRTPSGGTSEPERVSFECAARSHDLIQSDQGGAAHPSRLWVYGTQHSVDTRSGDGVPRADEILTDPWRNLLRSSSVAGVFKHAMPPHAQPAVLPTDTNFSSAAGGSATAHKTCSAALLIPLCYWRDRSQPAPPNRNPIYLTASAAKRLSSSRLSGSYQLENHFAKWRYPSF
jgi:hypothetical protein